MFFTASSEARITHDAPSVICELLPGVTLPQGRSKAGLSLARLSAVVCGPHAVIVVVDRAVAREGGLDLAGEIAVRVARRQSLLAFGRVFVRLPPRNVKEMRDQLRGPAHIEIGDRVGEAALESDHRREERRTAAQHRRKPGAEAARGKQPRRTT